MTTSYTSEIKKQYLTQTEETDALFTLPFSFHPKKYVTVTTADGYYSKAWALKMLSKDLSLPFQITVF